MIFPGLACGGAVLQRQSHDVLMYLDRAHRARERAQESLTKTERAFHERMENTWMNLAASVAFAERVDLFLHTLQHAALPCDGCPECRSLMRISTIESAKYQDIFTFECRSCGSIEQRTVSRELTPDRDRLVPPIERVRGSIRPQ
jgi:hypothetical protein